MSWETPVQIFEDEDEDALISKFVEMSAAYPHISPHTITAHLFQKLKDPDARALQAAVIWSKNFDIIVRIDEAKKNGNKEPKELTKAELQAKYLALVNDTTLTANEKKVNKEIYDSIADINGWKMKPGEGADGEGVTNNFPTIIYGLAPEALKQQAA